MRADTAAAGFKSIANEVILRRQNIADIFFVEEPFSVFRQRHRKRVVGKGPFAVVGFFKKWEFIYPSIGQDSLLFILRRAQIEFICTEFLHGLCIRKTRERFFFYGETHILDCLGHHILNHLHNIFLFDERHLNVYLRVLKSAVCPQVFIAHRAGNLEIFFKPGSHQELLILLR